MPSRRVSGEISPANARRGPDYQHIHFGRAVLIVRSHQLGKTPAYGDNAIIASVNHD